MKHLKEYNTYEFEVPEQIIDDLSADEEILFKLNTISPSIYEKIFNYMIYGLGVFVIVSAILIIIRTNGKAINSFFFWPIFLIFLPSIFLFLIFTDIKSGFTTEFFLIITNKRIFLYTKDYPKNRSEHIEFYDSFDLDSAIFLTYKIKKCKNQTIFKGDINMILEHGISIKNVRNIEKNINLIESILWIYGNFNKKLKEINENKQITYPRIFNIKKELWEDFYVSKKKNTIAFGLSLSALILGIIGLIFMLMIREDLGITVLSFIFLSSFGFSFLIFPTSRLIQIKKNLASNKDITLVLNKDKISFTNLDSSKEINFNNNIYINFSQMINFKSKSREYVGALHIKPYFDSQNYIKFGPIDNYGELIEIIYLNLLEWKAKQGILENKQQIIEKQKCIQKEQLIIDEKEKLLVIDKKGEYLVSDLTLNTKILLSLCIIITILIGVPFIVNLIYFSIFDISDPFYITGFLISIYGILRKKKYGFIIIIIESAFHVIISIIFLYEIDIIIFGVILVISVLEFRNYKKNYQQSIEAEDTGICPNCGKLIYGKFCSFCGYNLGSLENILPLKRDNPNLAPFLNYLNPNENVFFSFIPEININKKILQIIIGFICLMMFFVILFISLVLFLILFIPIIIGMIWGIMTLCSLSGSLAMKRSIFIFTDQKIIAKYDKHILMTPYLNIASISSMTKKTHYEVEILLKKAIESSPFINKFGIYIPHVPKNSDLIDKIKHLRKKATQSNNNLIGDG